MSIEILINKLTELGKITDIEKNLVQTNFKLETYKKNELLITSKDDCNKIFFVLEGALRIYHSNELGIEMTRTFIFENNFGTNIISFSKQDENKENIQALEDVLVMTINREDFYKMLDKSPILMKLYLKFLEHSFSNSLQLFEFLNTYSERQRIEKCFTEFPEITNRIKDKIIATYVGVSPEFFSRVKSDLLKKR